MHFEADCKLAAIGCLLRIVQALYSSYMSLLSWAKNRKN